LQLQGLLLSLSTTPASNKVSFATDVENICIDTGALACISNRKENFESLQPIQNLKINGIGTGLPIKGIGRLKLPIRDGAGNKIDLYVHNALYVPKAPMGLVCPQQIAMQTGKPGDGFHALGHAGILTVDGYKMTIPYDLQTRLPIFQTIEGITCYLTHHQDQPYINLTKAQLLMLKWHNGLSHLHFGKIQDLARQGKLPKALIGCDPPICHSCQYGKAHRRPSVSKDAASPIDSEDLRRSSAR
jgi:hypothetical protein